MLNVSYRLTLESLSAGLSLYPAEGEAETLLSLFTVFFLTERTWSLFALVITVSQHSAGILTLNKLVPQSDGVNSASFRCASGRVQSVDGRCIRCFNRED